MSLNNIFKVRYGALGAILGVLVLLLVAVLIACPAANGGGSPTRYGYACVNGTPSSLIDAPREGLSRCVSCDQPLFFALIGISGEIGTTCRTVVEVGEAVRVGGPTSGFGVVEGRPFGLAAIGNTLYMLGFISDALYTLDTTTGNLARVGGATEFGVSEGKPTGLAAIDNTLYMVGDINKVLYTLNIDPDDSTTDGSAIQVGSLSAGFGMNELLPTGLAAIDNTLYMVGFSNEVLYTLNIDPTDGTDDGRAIQVGSMAAGFGVSETEPNDLAAIGSTLYMVGQVTDALYTLDTVSGGATRVGLANQFSVGEERPTGLAAIDNTLYMVGLTTDALHAVRYQ